MMSLTEIANDFKNIRSRHYHKVWEPFMKKHECNIVCELGVYKGDNFLEMIAHEPNIAIAVDSWKDNGIHPRKYDDYTQPEFDSQYEYFKKQVADKPFVKIIRDSTTNASKEFNDNYFDFVYIDAEHTIEGASEDIKNWYPKVKIGKFLVGHDYKRRFGVVEAVNEFVSRNNLEMFFLSPSNWMVIKK